jgi:Fe-S cluster assembly protein SufD
VASLLAGSGAVPKSPAAWLDARRAAALERANALAVPTTRDEEWRFTDLTPLTRLQFQPVAAAANVSAADIAAYAVAEAAVRLVFVDASTCRRCRRRVPCRRASPWSCWPMR